MQRSPFLLGGSVLLILAGAAPEPPATTTRPSRRDLAQQQVEVAQRALDVSQKMYDRGLIEYSSMAPWHNRLLEAQLATDPPKAKVLQLLQAHVDQAKKFESLAAERFQAGVCTELDLLQAKWARLDAESRLAAAAQ